MARVKVTDEEFDIQSLEDAEYNEDEDFDTYDGELPENDTILTGYIKSMWWTMTGSNKRMFKILFIAADNDEPEDEYDGLPIWDNPFFSPDGKFRWKPFIDNFGVSLLDIKKKLYLGDEDHPRFGAPVDKVGTLVPGGDTSWARVLTKIGFDQDGNRRVEVKKWLPLEDEEEPEPDDEEPDDEPDEPDDEYDDEGEEDDEEDDEDEEDDDEGDDEPEPPARGRGRRPAPAATKSTAKAAPARGRGRAAAKPAAAKAAPARGGRAAAAPARGAKTRTAAAKPVAATRGRRSAKAAQDEPPF